VALTATAVRPANKPPDEPVSEQPMPRVPVANPSGSSSATEASIAESLRVISEHLADLSRTMRFVRRIAWGVLISSVLTVLVYGYLAWVAVGFLRPLSGGGGGLQDLLQLDEGAGQGDGSPRRDVQELLRQMQGLQQEYQRALDDAMR
jgi:hypothetical protein